MGHFSLDLLIIQFPESWNSIISTKQSTPLDSRLPYLVPLLFPWTQENKVSNKFEKFPFIKHTTSSIKANGLLLFCDFASILRLPWLFLWFCLDKNVPKVCTCNGVAGVEPCLGTPSPQNATGSPLQFCWLPCAPEHNTCAINTFWYISQDLILCIQAGFQKTFVEATHTG